MESLWLYFIIEQAALLPHRLAGVGTVSISDTNTTLSDDSPCPELPGPAPGFAKDLYYAMLCYAMLCYAMLCYAMLCYAMLYYTILYHATLCYTILCDGDWGPAGLREHGECALHLLGHNI